MENKQLPKRLNKDLNRIQDGIKQWSQLVAWSWTDYLAFKSNGENKSQEQKQEEEKLAMEEEKLKNFFIKILQDQARYRYAVSSYGDETKKGAAYAASIKIKKLVMGKNNEITELKEAGITLTLPQVYHKLTKEALESLADEKFMTMFHVEIVTDSFSGYIRDILVSEKEEIKEEMRKITENDLVSKGSAEDSEKIVEKELSYVNDVQYIIYLAYPPCPPLGKATVTEEQLINWMLGENATDYLPPSAYIPVSAT